MATRETRRLLKAAVEGNLDEIRSALAAGADIDGREAGAGRTALIEAVIGGHPEAVRIILGADPDLEVRERSIGLTALGWTGGRSGGPEAARLLLAAGADIEARQTKVGATPLIWAASDGDVEVMRVLLAAGADVSAKDAFGDTALSRATKRKHAAAAELLTSHGATMPVIEEPVSLSWSDLADGDDPDHSDPVRLVRGFILAMEAWESQAYTKVTYSDSAVLQREGTRVAAPYLSEKRRYEPWAFSSSPQFQTDDSLMEVRQPTRTRAEVIVHSTFHPPVRTERVFVVIRRGQGWRIDQIKERALVFDDNYRNLLRARPAPRADGLSDLDLAFATLEERRPLVKADGDPLRELRVIEDPTPFLERLLALRDHPDLWVLQEVWRTIARVRTSEALETIFDLADSDPPEGLCHTAHRRILNDADPRAQRRALELIKDDQAAYAVNNDEAGRQLLWEGWLRYRNRLCIDRLASFRDPRAIGPLSELLLDPTTPERLRTFLAHLAEAFRDEQVVHAVRSAAEKGLLDRKIAVRTLIQMWAHDDAERLVTRDAFSDDEEAKKWATDLDFVKSVRTARGA